MNADMTVEQIQNILVDMGEVMGGMDSTITNLAPHSRISGIR